MKKIISLILCVLMLVPCFSLACMCEEETTEYALGDVTMDGKISLLDVANVIQYCARWDMKHLDFNPECADVNCDGKINAVDAGIILKYCVEFVHPR